MKQRIVLDQKTGKILTTIPKFTQGLLEEMTKYVQETDDPLISDLALHIGVSRNTIRNWYDSIPEFKPLYDYMMTKQESRVFHGIADGTMNVIGGIFRAKAVLGFKDHPDDDKDTTINVTTISYKKEEAKAKHDLKVIKSNKHVTKRKKKVDKVKK